MSDILNLIEEIKGKGKLMNDNLTAYSQTNGAFRVKIRERLEAINTLIQQLNLADVGKNRAALEQANKDLEITRKQLEVKQQELQQTRDSLTQAQKELATANQSTQAVNDQMKALQEESEKKMNDLAQQHAQELEQLRQENAKQLSDSQNATQAEKAQMAAENEQKVKDAEARCNEEKQQMQAQIEEQRKAMDDQMKEAQLAREGAEQKLASLQDSQGKIQVGLSEINQLIENQLTIIQQVIATEPTNENLNAVVDAINQNLGLAMNMLNQAQVQAQNVYPSITNNFQDLGTIYNGLSEEQKAKLFGSNKASRANFESSLDNTMRVKDTDPRLFRKEMNRLSILYNEYVAKAPKSGGRRRRHIVTKHTAKRPYRMPRLSAKPPSSSSVLNPTKPFRKTRKVKKQRGGYMYKEDASLRKKSSIVEDKRTSRSSRETRKRTSRRSSRMTKKRA